MLCDITPYRKNKIWTSLDIKSLILMKNKGLSLKEISSNFEVTVNAVSKALTRYHPNYTNVHKTENINQNFSIQSIYFAIQCFNKDEPIETQIFIKKNNSVYDNIYYTIYENNLSLISVLILINQKRLKQNLKIIELNFLKI